MKLTLTFLFASVFFITVIGALSGCASSNDNSMPQSTTTSTTEETTTVHSAAR